MSQTASSASPRLNSGLISPDKHRYASIAITKSHNGSITSHTSPDNPSPNPRSAFCPYSSTRYRKPVWASTALSPLSLASLSSKVIFPKYKSAHPPVNSTYAQKDSAYCPWQSMFLSLSNLRVLVVLALTWWGGGLCNKCIRLVTPKPAAQSSDHKDVTPPSRHVNLDEALFWARNWTQIWFPVSNYWLLEMQGTAKWHVRVQLPKSRQGNYSTDNPVSYSTAKNLQEMKRWGFSRFQDI